VTLMTNPGTDGVPTPDDEYGNSIDDEQRNGRKSESDPPGWEHSLAERRTKLNDEQRSLYDRHISNAKERDGTVSPAYQLGVAAMLAKTMSANAFGKELHDLNRKNEEFAFRLQHAPAKPAADRQPVNQIRASSIGRADSPAAQPAVKTVVQRQADTPSLPAASSPQKSPPADRVARNDADVGRPLPPRKAAPDRTGLVKKRFQNIVDQHAERRRELKLPPSRAEQKEFARLKDTQEATRKALLEQRSAELKLLDYQHVAERTGMAAEWLARDLRSEGKASEAAVYDKESREADEVARLAYERRQTLVSKSTHQRGWEDAASTSTDARSSARQDDQRTAGPQLAPAAARQSTIAPPLNEDPTAYFKDKSGALLTEDRLRTMLGRYEEIRETRFMPSGLNENDRQSRLADAQAKVQKGLLDQQQKMSQLLDHQHQAERVGVSATWLAKDTHQLRYRAEARRAFSVARFAVERSRAIDPRAGAMNDQLRNANEQSDRQSTLQEAAKGGRTLSSEERANVPASAASAARGRSTRSSERSLGVGKDRGSKPGPKPSRGGNSRGGGGRGGR
jgi:hypothetical protein